MYGNQLYELSHIHEQQQMRERMMRQEGRRARGRRALGRLSATAQRLRRGHGGGGD